MTEPSKFVARSRSKEDCNIRTRSDSRKRKLTSPNSVKPNPQSKKKQKNKNQPSQSDEIMGNQDKNSQNNDNNQQVSNEMLLNEMKSGFKRMYDHISEEIQQVKGQIEGISSELNNVSGKVEELKIQVNIQQQHITELKSEVNSLNQQRLQNKVIIYGFPFLNDEFDFLTCINNFFKINIGNEQVKSMQSIKNSSKRTATVFIDFWDLRFAIEFLKLTKKKQKDAQSGKFIPILAEQLVNNLPENDKRRGTQVNFKMPMTNVNKEIFMKARALKYFKFVWIDQTGYVKVKKDEGMKAIKVSSVSHLESLVHHSN